jgi:hypothetical protein
MRITSSCPHIVVMTSDTTADVTLTTMSQLAVTWAIEKMQEEDHVKTLAETNKSVAIALENLNTAKQQLAVTIFLSKEQ